jgi:hypothetical protein
MQIAAAQSDMSRAHVHGAPGVFVSGAVWLVAGALWDRHGVTAGFSALFIGGILIFPASMLISRVVFRAPAAIRGNPLERLALESTFVLFAGILLAWCFLRVAPELAFPAMAVSIGVRYLIFRSIYGHVLYWVLGAALTAVGALAALALVALPVNLALIVGGIEIGLSAAILMLGRSADRKGRPDTGAV